VLPVLGFLLGYYDRRKAWAVLRYTSWWKPKGDKPEILYQLQRLPDGYWLFSAEIRFIRALLTLDPRTLTAVELSDLQSAMSSASQRITSLLTHLK
jgi:hypothetical protein